LAVAVIFARMVLPIVRSAGSRRSCSMSCAPIPEWGDFKRFMAFATCLSG
jgi:hypothetical protein